MSSSVDKQGARIREMFSSIAPRYDLLNRLLSLRMDQSWRRRTAARVASRLGPRGPVLDLCTGTGDLALALARFAPVIGCDFAAPMLKLAREKTSRAGAPPIRYLQADALQLPFPAGRFGAVAIAFGLRNLEDCGRGLAEMRRVLEPGGVLAVLEFSQPTAPVLSQLYHFYFHHLLPRIGQAVSGKEGPYSYLPQSVREFPEPDDLDRLLEASGFEDARHEAMTLRVVTLHLAKKPEK